jgi:hypothetical protein
MTHLMQSCVQVVGRFSHARARSEHEHLDLPLRTMCLPSMPWCVTSTTQPLSPSSITTLRIQ